MNCPGPCVGLGPGPRHFGCDALPFPFPFLYPQEDDLGRCHRSWGGRAEPHDVLKFLVSDDAGFQEVPELPPFPVGLLRRSFCSSSLESNFGLSSSGRVSS